jgi:hypothetical protein
MRGLSGNERSLKIAPFIELQLLLDNSKVDFINLHPLYA